MSHVKVSRLKNKRSLFTHPNQGRIACIHAFVFETFEHFKVSAIVQLGEWVVI